MPDRPLPASADPSSDEPAGAAPGANFQLSQDPVTAATAQPTASTAPSAPAYEHLGELPASYGGPSVYLVAYDPRRLFAYWDLDPATAPRAGTALALRVRRADTGEVESQVPVQAPAGGPHPGQYLPVQRAGASYLVELGHGGDAGMPWRVLAVSARVAVPPEGLAAADTDAQFATLPFHLSFQRLADLLRGVLPAGGDQPGLTEALGQLQTPGQGEPTGASGDPGMLHALSRLSPEQQRHLQMVLGTEAQVFSGTSASYTTSTTGDSSEGFATRGVAGKPGGSEALSSGAFTAGSLSSGQFHVHSAAFAQTGPGGGSGGLSSSAAPYRPGAAGGSESAARRQLGIGPSSADFLARPGPSSEAWRRAAVGGGAAGGGGSSGGGGGGSDVFARERAERFLRAVTSSLDVLGALFSASGAGASGLLSPSSSPSSRGRW